MSNNKYKNTYVEFECKCCHKVFFLNTRAFTNTCECGADYNSRGELLAPRSCWGEETGEHPADIARIK